MSTVLPNQPLSLFLTLALIDDEHVLFARRCRDRQLIGLAPVRFLKSLTYRAKDHRQVMQFYCS